MLNTASSLPYGGVPIIIPVVINGSYDAMGRRPYLTPEQREESRKRQNKRRSLATLVRRTAQRAAKALQEGREPGKAGAPRLLADDERAAHRAAAILKYRQENIEKIRVRDATNQRRIRAEHALAEGRTPGRIGREPIFTDEQRRAKRMKNSLSYWDENPDRRPILAKQYYEANKEKVASNVRHRRARQLNNGGTHTVADIRALYAHQNGLCAFCANPFGDVVPHIDHWVPLARGGSNGAENLRLLHPTCNRRKGAKMPSEFGLPNEAHKKE